VELKLPGATILKHQNTEAFLCVTLISNIIYMYIFDSVEALDFCVPQIRAL
jgi:hypothetical protein